MFHINPTNRTFHVLIVVCVAVVVVLTFSGCAQEEWEEDVGYDPSEGGFGGGGGHIVDDGPDPVHVKIQAGFKVLGSNGSPTSASCAWTIEVDGTIYKDGVTHAQSDYTHQNYTFGFINGDQTETRLMDCNALDTLSDGFRIAPGEHCTVAVEVNAPDYYPQEKEWSFDYDDVERWAHYDIAWMVMLDEKADA